MCSSMLVVGSDKVAPKGLRRRCVVCVKWKMGSWGLAAMS